MTANRQLLLLFDDGKESQAERLRRVLAGVPRVATAARFFDERAFYEATKIAWQESASSRQSHIPPDT